MSAGLHGSLPSFLSIGHYERMLMTWSSHGVKMHVHLCTSSLISFVCQDTEDGDLEDLHTEMRDYVLGHSSLPQLREVALQLKRSSGYWTPGNVLDRPYIEVNRILLSFFLRRWYIICEAWFDLYNTGDGTNLIFNISNELSWFIIYRTRLW